MQLFGFNPYLAGEATGLLESSRLTLGGHARVGVRAPLMCTSHWAANKVCACVLLVYSMPAAACSMI